MGGEVILQLAVSVSSVANSAAAALCSNCVNEG